MPDQIAATAMAAPKPVKVYGWAVSPFVARALVCLEEAGVDYELVAMSADAGDHRRPDHLARNPFGQVPVLEDGDLTLFESRAIARHVLRKHKPELLGGGSLERSAMVDAWLEVETHQHHPAALAIMLQCIIAPLVGGARPGGRRRERRQAPRGARRVRGAAVACRGAPTSPATSSASPT